MIGVRRVYNVGGRVPGSVLDNEILETVTLSSVTVTVHEATGRKLHTLNPDCQISWSERASKIPEADKKLILTDIIRKIAMGDDMNRDRDFGPYYWDRNDAAESESYPLK